MTPIITRLRSWIARQIAPSKPRRNLRQTRGRRLRAGYDAAQPTIENDDRWPTADSYNANAAQDHWTRQTLRDRSRNEVANNSYAAGLVEGIANDVVGTGPRLQLSIPGVDRTICAAIESAWANWSRAIDLAEDLRVLHQTRLRDGEGFAVLINNPTILQTGQTVVGLDLKLYEAEQISDPYDFGMDPLYVDGIKLDERGNRVSYAFLRNHPGGVYPLSVLDPVTLPARDVLHWYRPDRPGQTRGVPALTPGLPLFAQLRRYTLATLTAAELAAEIAGIMKTNANADTGEEVEVEALQDIDLVRGMLLTLPKDWSAEQFHPEQPVNTYGEFKNQVLGEIGRGVLAPFNVIAGNSSGYNYSSGRLDHLLYQRAIRVERDRFRVRILDRIFIEWIGEALLAGVVQGLLPRIATWSWSFHWDGFESIDPLKDAQTDQIEIAIGKTTLAEIHARKGQDWETAMRQRAAELALAQQLEREFNLPAGSLSGKPIAEPAAPEVEEEVDAEAATEAAAA